MYAIDSSFRHPHDFRSPRTNLLAEAVVSFPHLHLHSHRADFHLSLPTRATAVRRPNARPTISSDS
jgi:hypothetical protein